MPGIDAESGMLMVPFWAAGAVSAIFAAAVALAIGRAGASTFITAAFRVAVLIVGLYAGWLYWQRSSTQEQLADRRSLSERSVALTSRSIAPGSALSCLDELAGEVVEAACERAVFASPESIAASVSYTAARLDLLADASIRNPAFAAELAPVRAALEMDRFGILAHVLEVRGPCTAEKCDALARFNDPTHVLDNLRSRAFDEQVTRFTALWNSPAARVGMMDSGSGMGGGAAAAAAAAVAAAPGAPAPGPVSTKYDFPSAQSIPAMSIMAPEPGAPRQGNAAAAAAAAAAADAQANQTGGTGGGSVTPVPPRRPPQVRTTPVARPPVVRPDVAANPGDPGDGPITRGLGAAGVR